ncbi:DUF5990 family protein [Streptomyces sp. NPDC101733]|uniref:DUF5990 family protein n=1 Tax=unclassified Streptomyces TaxID=2593676 RepID=UPI0037FBCCF1
MSTLAVRVTGRDLPGRVFGELRHVHVAVQRGRDPEGPVPGDAAGVVWEFAVTVVAAPDGTLDHRGPHVQGRRGARFFHLTWGDRPPGGEFVMFRRAKLYFADLPAGAPERGTVEGNLALSDARGTPLCGSVRPPTITWT